MSNPSEFKVGDILVAVGEVQNNLGFVYKDGTEFRVDRLDTHQRPCISLEPPGDYHDGGYWFYFGSWAANNGYTNNFVVKGE